MGGSSSNNLKPVLIILGLNSAHIPCPTQLSSIYFLIRIPFSGFVLSAICFGSLTRYH